MSNAKPSGHVTESSFRLGAATHRGGRDKNEDACACVETDDGSVVVLADGAGGHAGGEVASDIVVREAVQYFQDHADARGPRAVVEAMRGAHQALRAAIAATPKYREMRSTILIVHATRSQAWVGHVGDSRAYLVRGGKATPLTRDDTLVQSLVDLGNLPLDAARKHSQSHVLLQCLGEPRELDYHVTDALVPSVGDVLVACSDGLCEVLPDDEIARLAAGGAVKDAARMLVEAAIKRGASDNVTVAVISWHSRRQRPQVAMRGRVVKARRRQGSGPLIFAAVSVMVAMGVVVAAKLRQRAGRVPVPAVASARLETHREVRGPTPSANAVAAHPDADADADAAVAVAVAAPRSAVAAAMVDAGAAPAALVDAGAPRNNDLARAPAPRQADVAAQPVVASAPPRAPSADRAGPTGLLRLRGAVPGTRAFVEDVEVPLGEDGVLPLPAGRRVFVRFTAPGYQDQLESIRLAAGASLRLRVRLRPEPAAAPR